MSAEEYDRIRGVSNDELDRLCERVSKQAAERGLTDEVLADLLKDGCAALSASSWTRTSSSVASCDSFRSQARRQRELGATEWFWCRRLRWPNCPTCSRKPNSIVT